MKRKKEPLDLTVRIIGVFVGAINLVSGGWNLYDQHWITGGTQVTFGIVFTMWFKMRDTWIDIGYRRGRMAMFESMGEASRRGLNAAEWFAAEVERDLVDLTGKKHRKII